MPTVRVDSERKGIGGAQGGNREISEKVGRAEGPMTVKSSLETPA